MTRTKWLFVALMLATMLAMIPAANAQTLHFLGVGSSAMYQGFEVAVVNDVAPSTTTCGGVSGVGVNCTIHHYTVKSTSGCATPCAQIEDARISPIDFETANAWVVYVCSGITNCTTVTDVWAYQQVDSTVGDRSFLSRPAGCVLTGSPASCHKAAVVSLLDATTKSSVVGQNVVSPALLQYGVNSLSSSCGAQTTCDDQFIASAAWTAVSGTTGVPVTVGMTDIRPEDAKYATKRLNKPYTGSPWTGLGYSTSGSAFVGTPIKSAFSLTFATPIEFGLPGFSDPITSEPVPTTITTIPVGEDPIVFLTNRSNSSGLGSGFAVGTVGTYNNLIDNNGISNLLGSLYSGVNCDGSNAAFGSVSGTFPINLIEREGLSGTMNTTEFSAFRIYSNPGGAAGNSASLIPTTSQEANINLANPNTNPLNLTCTATDGNPQGNRYRAIGTGEEVAQVVAHAGSANTDTIGYTFFSFGNVSSAGLSSSYGYLTLDGVDPIFETYNGTGSDPGQPAGGTTFGTNNGTYWPGTLPKCDVTGVSTVMPACRQGTIWASGNSFPHLRDGTYRAWSLLRAVCDSSDGNCLDSSLGAAGIIAAAQSDIDSNKGVPDFLPLQDVTYVRAHYNFVLGTGPSSHSTPQAHFFNLNTNIEDVPQDTYFGGAPDAGGDAGGCIVPVNNVTVSITSATAVPPSHTKYNYSGGTLSVGQSITISGFTGGALGDNGTFLITKIPSPGVIKTNNA